MPAGAQLTEMRRGPQGRGAEGENQPQPTGRNHEANWKQRERFQTALQQEVKTCINEHERHLHCLMSHFSMVRRQQRVLNL